MRTLKVTKSFSYFIPEDNKVCSVKVGDIIYDDNHKFNDILKRKNGEEISIESLPIDVVEEIPTEIEKEVKKPSNKGKKK